MYVKRLSVYGFKSFALETNIDFNEGVTVVLGPNGIGKSNIVEAFLWVLGEQSTNRLRLDRSQGLESIIFHGTDTRKASSLAEVTLTLDNTSRWLKNHDTDEVVVKRKYYRKGLSEYYINDNPIRLKDITDLFLDTGFGKSTYSVIKQGMVDKIAQQNPEDRRALIEDAAGISKYLERRREANKKLEDSEKNLMQVKTMIREAERNFKQLKEQAERTERYYKLQDEKKQLKISISLSLILKLERTKEELQKDYENQVSARENIEKDLIELENKKKDQTKHFEETREIASDLDKRSSLLFNDITHTERIYNQINGQIGNLTQEIADAKKRKENLSSKFNDENARINELEKSHADVSEAIASSVFTQEQYEKQIAEENGNIENFDENIKHLNEENARLQGEITNLRVKQKEVIDKIISEIDEKKRDVEKMSFYQNRDKHEQDIEIGFSNLLSSIKQKAERILEFENLGVLKDNNDANYNRLVDFVISLRDKLDVEEREAYFLKEIFDEYNKIKDPFIEILFNKEGTYTQKEAIDNAISEFEKEVDRNRISIEEFNTRIKYANEIINEVTSKLTTLSVNRARHEEKRISIEEAKERSIKIKISLEEDMSSQAAKTEKLEISLSEIKNELLTNGEKLKDLKNKRKDMENEVKVREKEIKDAVSTISSVEENLSKRMKKLSDIKETCTRISMRIEEAKNKIASIYDEFYERYSIRLSELENKDEKTDSIKLKEKLDTINEKIKTLGQINEMALDEYQVAKERYEFLTKQKDDLDKAKIDILNVIEETNKKASLLFKETFDAINEKFSETFRSLFGGGKAGLVLQNEEDILNSPIDIFAQPPGKKMENIVAYSGGELTMTGLALVFAIFLYRPSPFCILDEVDAALDGANIIRYKNMVKSLSNNTQFLVITHDEVSATIATTYYGVTAEEKGVSKVYTVKIDKNGSVNGSKESLVAESAL